MNATMWIKHVLLLPSMNYSKESYSNVVWWRAKVVRSVKIPFKHLYHLNIHKINQACLFGGSFFFQSHKYTYYNRLPELMHHCYNEGGPDAIDLCCTSFDGLQRTAAPRDKLLPLKCPKVKHIGAFCLCAGRSWAMQEAEPQNGVKMIIRFLRTHQKMSFFFITAETNKKIC